MPHESRDMTDGVSHAHLMICICVKINTNGQMVLSSGIIIHLHHVENVNCTFYMLDRIHTSWLIRKTLWLRILTEFSGVNCILLRYKLGVRRITDSKRFKFYFEILRIRHICRKRKIYWKIYINSMIHFEVNILIIIVFLVYRYLILKFQWQKHNCRRWDEFLS